jgi:hypothetical protein
MCCAAAGEHRRGCQNRSGKVGNAPVRPGKFTPSRTSPRQKSGGVEAMAAVPLHQALRNSSGSLAILLTILRASSLLSNLAAAECLLAYQIQIY